MTNRTTPQLLIVDDNEDLLASWQRAFRKDFDTIVAASKQDALKELDYEPDVALFDIRLSDKAPEKQEGLELLQIFKGRYPDLPVVMISAYGDISTAVECMKLGAVDFVEKKDTLLEIRQRLYNALDRGKEVRRTRLLQEYIARKEPVDIIGESQSIKKLKADLIIAANDGYINVLILGETGTGKELVARAIHKYGKRKENPFTPVPIISLPETTIESELFGHEQGAFTDARKRRIGWIEKARGGVLFLDEIGDLPAHLQAKLLRFLEERNFSRLGSTKKIDIDLQVVSATNMNLENAVAEKSFRDDLYYRLKGFIITIPPLRERKEDIPLLAAHYLFKLKESGRSKISAISDDAMKTMLSYDWPGNVRELNLEIERAALVADQRGISRIETGDLSKGINNHAGVASLPSKEQFTAGFSIAEHLARTELSYIEEAMQSAGGKKAEAAKLLGLNDRFALRRRVKSIEKKFPHLVHDFERLFGLYFF